jgi:plastocyanin
MPADDVLVYAQPLDAHIALGDDAPAVLNIIERHFEPAVLPVRAGGRVTIQNLDGVVHDVYSFSPARPLSFHLAAGERKTGVEFPHAGVVAVGCKVYNEVQGYIYVTDAPYFGTTDLNGYLRLGGLPPGRYRIGAWSHAIPARDFPGFPVTLTLKAGPDTVVRIRIRNSRPVGAL